MSTHNHGVFFLESYLKQAQMLSGEIISELQLGWPGIIIKVGRFLVELNIAFISPDMKYPNFTRREVRHVGLAFENKTLYPAHVS
jgi:hypothetical protein